MVLLTDGEEEAEFLIQTRPYNNAGRFLKDSSNNCVPVEKCPGVFVKVKPDHFKLNDFFGWYIK